MASSLTLKRLVSTNLLNRSLRPVGSATFASSSRFSGTDGHSFNSNSNRRSDAPDFHRISGCLDVTDVTTSPLLSRLNQIINTVHPPIASGISSNGDVMGTMKGCLNVTDVTTSPLSSRSNQILNAVHSPIASGISSNGDVMGTMNGCLNITDVTTSSFSRHLNQMNGGRRNFSTVAAHPEESYQKKSLRPLSPHLPIYQPQLSSTTSILNRISGMILTSTILGSYLYLKVGSVAFTYGNFYQFFYYSTNLVPIALEISALALVYHVYAGIGHLAADFSGNLRTPKKH